MNSFSPRNTITTATSIKKKKPSTNKKLTAPLPNLNQSTTLPFQLPLLKSSDMPHIQLTSPSLALNEEKIVKKLSYWDREHLKTHKASSDHLYLSLKQFYIKENKQKEQSELEELNYLLKTRSNMNLLAKSTPKTQGTALQTFVDNKNKEEGAILINSITKTKNRFNTSLYGVSSQKELGSELNIDSGTMKVVQSEGVHAEYYSKLIKEKAQMEEVMRQELLQATQAVFNKKKEREEKVQELNREYSLISQINKEFKDQLNELARQEDQLQDDFSKESRHYVTKAQKGLTMTKTLSRTNELENSICILKATHKRNIAERTRKVNQLTAHLNHLLEQEEYLKYVKEELLKENQIYFFSILFKGYDVRNEGLAWVVKNLLETQANLEYHHFPKFLSHEDIDYLISLASLTLEEQQSIIILNVLKHKQKNLKCQSNYRRFSMLDEYIQNKNPTQFQDPREKHKDKGLLLLMSRFNAIETKHRDIIKDTAEGHLEDFKVNKIYEEIHSSLVESLSNAGSSKRVSYSRSLFENFFEGNKDSREYLELILYYRERITQIKALKTKIKEKAMTDFKERQYLNKNRYSNVKVSIQYELLFKALFGLNIQGS